MKLLLQGKIITPLISKKPAFFIKGCRTTILNPRRRYFSKITADKPMYPYSFICYLGELELRYTCRTLVEAKRKLTSLLKIKSIGRFSSEGLGKIQWKHGKITQSLNYSTQKKKPYWRKVRIRKGLPHKLPQAIQDLIRYALLHDFYQTHRHKSKIYVEPELNDLDFTELLRQHHEETNNPLIQTFQKYDRIAARITRKIRSPKTNRYNWYAKENIDFEQLAQEIKEVNTNIWKLYDCIYHNQKLKQLNESLEHGYTSLRTHLLVIANLIVQDFQQQRLKEFCTSNETGCRCLVNVSSRT